MATITSIVSLNQLIEWFESFADRHYFLKDFGFGEPYDIGTTRQMEFPYMWVTLNDTSSIATGTNVKSAIPDYSFGIFFMDKINIQENYLDQNGFQSDNSQQILSDTIQYMQDLITEIQQDWAQYGVMLSSDVTFNPVIDETQDKSTGISAQFTLRTRQVNCVIPVSPTNIVVQPSQQTYETLLTCETLEDCSTFQTYAYTGGTFTGSTLTLKSLNGHTFSVTGFTGGGGSTPTLQQVVNQGNGISNYGGIGNASIQSTNFTNNRTLYLNDNAFPTIRMVDNNNASNNLQIDMHYLLKYNAQIDLLKYMIITCCVALIGSVLFHSGLFSSTFYTTYLIIVFSIGFLAIIYKYFDIFGRSKLNFNEKDYDMLKPPVITSDISGQSLTLSDLSELPSICDIEKETRGIDNY